MNFTQHASSKMAGEDGKKLSRLSFVVYMKPRQHVQWGSISLRNATTLKASSALACWFPKASHFNPMLLFSAENLRNMTSRVKTQPSLEREELESLKFNFISFCLQNFTSLRRRKRNQKYPANSQVVPFMFAFRFHLASCGTDNN